MVIEWCEVKPSGEIIGDLKQWRLTIGGLDNPIHQVFYELVLFPCQRYAKPSLDAFPCSASSATAA